jgi:hypothetical protein
MQFACRLSDCWLFSVRYTIMPRPILLLRVVVASPGDVKAERDAVEEIIAEVNRDTARKAELYLELARWETDTRAGFHAGGPQGLIDPILNIDACELVIGIFWSRLGTPTPDGKTGTEHEFETAYKSWKINQRPEIMAYFCDRPAEPKSAEDRKQLKMIQNFKANFPKEGFAWNYTNLDQFKTFVASHVRQYVGEQIESIWNTDASSVRKMLEERKKEPATIAILGRVNEENRHDKPIFHTEECQQNLFEIGKQLAIADCHIMVYDSRPQYAANEVVAGYVMSGVAHDKSIRVRRPLSLEQDPFPGQTDVSTSHLFKDEPTPKEEWEIAFMPSLPESDGAIVVGNGQFTLQGGLHAVGGKLPLVVLAGYGGIARDVWEVFLGQRYRFANDDELSAMAGRGRDPAWAAECVRILLAQRRRRNALQIWRA